MSFEHVLELPLDQAEVVLAGGDLSCVATAAHISHMGTHGVDEVELAAVEAGPSASHMLHDRLLCFSIMVRSESDYYVSVVDVKSEVMRAKGAGGQHVNKTESAVRLTHIPTGIVVAMQDSRSQHKNREKAWKILRAKLAQRKREEREAEIARVRRSVMGGVGRMGREDKIRTYNFSQQRVSDHRSGKEENNLDDVRGGGEGLERLMESVREWMRENEVLGLLAEEEMKKEKEKALD